jgi:hypothetical protein
MVENKSVPLIQGLADAKNMSIDKKTNKLFEIKPKILSNVTLQSKYRPNWNLPIPRLRILIMTVGTRLNLNFLFYFIYGNI